MKKIIPVILICASVLSLLLGITALIITSIAVSVPQIAPLGAAAAIAALVPTLLCGGLCVLFRRDILCRIAFFICCGSFATAFAATVIWLAVL
ncbi:MAG: hypothetical protein OSJ83_03465 [Clostridia bacterium]|nr:hypothetical protein [Clostridia bacterium]